MNKPIIYIGIWVISCSLSSCEKCVPIILCPYRNAQFYSVQGTDTAYLYYPNAFSPNGDGLNDQFGLARRNIKSFTCQIYDASGGQIYEMTDQTFNWWDGVVNGKPEPVGVYAVKITAKTTFGTSVNLLGAVSLIGGQILGDFRKIDGTVYLELKNTEFESQFEDNYGFNPNISSGERILTDQVHNCR